MILKTLRFIKGQGWSTQSFPDLDSENTLIIIFADPEFNKNPDPIKELAIKYPKSKIIGCSDSGEISGDRIYEHSLSVAIVKFEKTPIKISTVSLNTSNESFNAGKIISAELNENDLRGIFVLSEGLNVNGSELVKGLNTINKNNVVITGGLAGDGDRFKETWTIINGEIQSNKVVAVGFYGDHVCIGHGSKGGWDIFGPERRITRSKGNILYELDGKSALELYKEYLGEKAAGLPATGLLFPLAIRKDLNDPKQLVRTILAVDENEGSLIFAGDMPMGYLAQLMRANFERLITGAKEAGELILKEIECHSQNIPDQILLIAISCVGRRLLLGERTEEETSSILKICPEGTELIGFYSYGELSPYAKGNCDLHNQTMTLTSICEDT